MLVNGFLLRYIEYMETIIVSFICSQLLLLAPGPQTLPACTSAATATSIKTGLRGDLNLIQDQGDKFLHHEVLDRVDMNTQRVAAVLYGGYGIATTHVLQFSTPFKPISDSLSVVGTSQSGTVTLSWAF